MCDSIDQYNIVMVAHVGCVIHLYLKSPNINIKEIYILIVICLLKSNHGS